MEAHSPGVMSSSIRLHLRLDEYYKVINLLGNHGQMIAASMASLQAPASALLAALRNFEVNEASFGGDGQVDVDGGCSRSAP